MLTTRDALSNTTSYSYNDSTRTMTVTTPEGIAVSTVHNRHGADAQRHGRGQHHDLHLRSQRQPDRRPPTVVGTLEGRTYDRGGRLLTQHRCSRHRDHARLRRGQPRAHAHRGLGQRRAGADDDLRLRRRRPHDRRHRAERPPHAHQLRSRWPRDAGGGRSEWPQPAHHATATTSKATRSRSPKASAAAPMPRATQYTYDNLGRRTERGRRSGHAAS